MSAEQKPKGPPVESVSLKAIQPRFLEDLAQMQRTADAHRHAVERLVEMNQAYNMAIRSTQARLAQAQKGKQAAEDALTAVKETVEGLERTNKALRAQVATLLQKLEEKYPAPSNEAEEKPPRKSTRKSTRKTGPKAVQQTPEPPNEG